MKTLQDRVAVVTGANGGIGRATCLALAKSGSHIALVDWKLDGVEETVRQIEALGRATSVHEIDVRERAAVEALPAAVLEAHGAVHVLVNNAGVTASDAFHEQSVEDFDWVLAINLGGVVDGTRAFLPHLLESPEAHVVNISSVFGIIGVPGQVAYCTSKFAVRGFTEALAEELAGTHVGTTVVHPGGINTGIVANARSAHGSNEAIQAKFAKATISPDIVGDRITKAILRGQRRLLVAPEAPVMDWLKRLMPTWGNTLVVRGLVKALGMEDEMKASQARAFDRT